MDWFIMMFKLEIVWSLRLFIERGDGLNICLTVDVESYTEDYEEHVYGNGSGLLYILETLRKHGAAATFFVEALGATRWGHEPFKKLCRQIHDAGHEKGLQIHPVVANLPGFSDTEDILWMHDFQTQLRLIEAGRDVMKECCISHIAIFRAGDLAANADTLRAMKSAGLLLGSNRDLDKKSTIYSEVNDLFPVRNDISSVDGITDLPVTAFRSPLPWLDGSYRHMQITALSFPEMAYGLMKMKDAGYSCATVLMHPHEFFNVKNKEFVPNKKNRARLESLLDFIKTQPDLSIKPATECAKSVDNRSGSLPEIRLPLHLSLQRVVEQAMARVCK
jgi:peptidoglycan/xylan/chitin deacetylase (PgdA/CDA1 family)